MEMNELDVLSSIYGQELQILSPSLVKLFVSDDAFVMTDLSGYPESLPKIHVSDSHSRNSEENGRRAVDEVLRGYRKGDAILFDALEAARQAMMVIHDHHEEEEEGRGKAEESGGEQMNPKQMERAVSPAHNLQQQPSEVGSVSRIAIHHHPLTRTSFIKLLLSFRLSFGMENHSRTASLHFKHTHLLLILCKVCSMC